MSSIISFIAKMVVQRRICEVPTQRQKLVPCWSNPPPTPNNIINLIYSCLLSDCWLLYCSRHSQHYHQYQTRWKFTPFFLVHQIWKSGIMPRINDPTLSTTHVNRTPKPVDCCVMHGWRWYMPIQLWYGPKSTSYGCKNIRIVHKKLS